MKTTRKIVLIAMLITIFSVCCTSCSHKSPPEGEWEGNYLYIGRSRMKTDGTEREVLVSSFTDDDGTVYELQESDNGQAKFYDRYMFIHVPYPRYTGEESTGKERYTGYALIVYDMKEKRSFLAASTGPYREKCNDVLLYKAFDDCFVVRFQLLPTETGVTTYSYRYALVDYNGNVLNEDDSFFQGSVNIYDRSVFHLKGGYLTYATLDDRTEIPLFACEDETTYVLRLHENVFVCNRIIFDPLTKKVNKIDKENVHLSDFIGYHFLTYEQRVDSVTRSGAALWRVNEDCSYEKILTFPQNSVIQYAGSAQEDEKYIRILTQPKNIKNSRDWYTYNKQTGAFFKGEIKLSDEIGDKYGCTDGIQCGRYFYNIYYPPGLGFGVHLFYLCRFNSETGETEKLSVLSGNGNAHLSFTVREY